MGHYAIIDKKTNLVREVIVVPNDKCQSPQKQMMQVPINPFEPTKTELREVMVMVDDEKKGIDWLTAFFKAMPEIKFGDKTYSLDELKFVQTSYNGNARYNFAGIGHTWDEKNGAFISPKPTLNPLKFDVDMQVVVDEKGNPVYLEGEWILSEKCKWDFVEYSAVFSFRKIATQNTTAQIIKKENDSIKFATIKIISKLNFWKWLVSKIKKLFTK